MKPLMIVVAGLLIASCNGDQGSRKTSRWEFTIKEGLQNERCWRVGEGTVFVTNGPGGRTKSVSVSTGTSCPDKYLAGTKYLTYSMGGDPLFSGRLPTKACTPSNVDAMRQKSIETLEAAMSVAPDMQKEFERTRNIFVNSHSGRCADTGSNCACLLVTPEAFR